MDERNRSAYVALVLIFFASISTIGLLIDRSQSQWLITSYFCAFFSFFWLVTKHSDENLLLLGVVVRLLLFFGLPTLSDDVYRFLWDGRLMNQGIDPYSVIPKAWVNQGLSAYDQQLFSLLNSPEYFSVYPPFNQWIFALATFFGGDQLLLSVNLLRALLFAAEIGSFFLMKSLLLKSGRKASLAFWYFLNPFIILEITGNLHFEGLVIFFILGGIYLLDFRKNLAGISIGLAIATKLLPLIFLPALFLKHHWKAGISLVLGCFVVGMFPFLFFSSFDSLEGLKSSLNLYFQKFEFNASVYYVVRTIGYAVKGYNIIETAGPVLSLFSTLLILYISLIGRIKSWSLSKTFLFCLTIYLMFSTTVHPWYITPLIPLGILSGYYFPIVWSLVSCLTYIDYQYPVYRLEAEWLIIEYLVVFGVLVYELYRDEENR